MKITHMVSVALGRDERFDIQITKPLERKPSTLTVHRLLLAEGRELAQVNTHFVVPVADLPEHIRALQPQVNA